MKGQGDAVVGPKVLHVIDNLGMGGAEVWLIALLRYWRERPGSPVIHILETGGAAGALEAEASALGATTAL